LVVRLKNRGTSSDQRARKYFYVPVLGKAIGDKHKTLRPRAKERMHLPIKIKAQRQPNGRNHLCLKENVQPFNNEMSTHMEIGFRTARNAA
jgi:hypothetical protein